ncbi:uroporphyrinogen-III synthase [Phyllobacterium sp. SB3]|uniref:uroporphyrinogen-III synthase n=1 Tax=Phyllobacterium sp. SB3 TaxID=3156073 RepID=UPI0032AFC09B
MKTVLVTRPEPGATRTAERLVALGFNPLVLPLTEIQPLPVQSPGGNYDAVTITSANALRYIPEDILAPLYHLPCFVVGEVTAELARNTGFMHVVTGDGDGASLAGKVNNSTPSSASLLYLTGQVRSSRFETIIGQSGRVVTPVAVYDTILKSYETDYLARLLKPLPVDVCLLYSTKGAEAFMDAIRKAGIQHLFEKTEFLCLSNSIAAVVSGQAFGRIATASLPDEAALLELLKA